MYSISSSQLTDLTKIALCHKECFATSLSIRLGIPYIKKTFEWFIVKEFNFLFHVTDEKNNIIGYCGGFCPQYNGDGSTSGMMRYAMKEALLGALTHPQIIFHREVIASYPLIFKNIYRKFLSTRNSQKKIENQSLEQRAGLVVIGILPSHRGRGVFEKLIKSFEEEAAARNIFKLVLSVKKENIRAINAYEKVGWFRANANNHTVNMIKILDVPCSL